MKIVLSIVAVCLVAACGGAGGAASNQPAGSRPIAIDDLPQVAVSEAPSRTLTSMLNGVRASNGAGPVSYDSRLGAAARRHANDMAANNFFSHTGSDGTSAGDRIAATGYRFITWGENIAAGQRNESTVLTAWVNSPGHQRNNVDPNFEDFALAKADSARGPYWVLVFATERP